MTDISKLNIFGLEVLTKENISKLTSGSELLHVNAYCWAYKRRTKTDNYILIDHATNTTADLDSIELTNGKWRIINIKSEEIINTNRFSLLDDIE